MPFFLKSRRAIRLYSLMICVHFVIGCKLFTSSDRGDNPGPSVTQSPSPAPPLPSHSTIKRNVLFILMGGFGSCNFDSDGTATTGPETMILAKAFATTFSDLSARGINVQMMASCFGVVSSDKIRYFTPAAPNDIKKTTIDPYLTEVSNALASSKADLFYVIGHSHGGWLAMRAMLQSHLQKRVEALFTLDAISHERCSSLTYLAGVYYLESNNAPVTPQGSCMTSPGDFDIAAVAKVRQATSQWVNIYQTDFKYLHSDQISGVENNQKLNYSNIDGNFHRSIASDLRTWEIIKKTVYAGIGL